MCSNNWRASRARAVPALEDRKINLLVDLLNRCSRQEARFVVRIVLGKLRLGVGEMIFLAGLSQALTGSKASKAVLEKAYNVLSDLGEVAERAMRSGIKSLTKVRPIVGKPIRMMLAQRIRDLSGGSSAYLRAAPCGIQVRRRTRTSSPQ